MAKSHIVLDPNGCIFNSVGSFVEQVGRRSVWKFNDLDMMTCIWNGPVAGAYTFMPKKGSAHPLYPFMFVTDAQITNQAALMADVQVTYTGIMSSSTDLTESNLGGQNNWLTKPILSWSPVQGSRDFQEFWSTTHVNSYVTSGISSGSPIINGVPQPISVLKTYYTYDYGTRTRTIRYAGQNVQVHYFSWPNAPTVVQHLDMAGKAAWRVLSNITGPYTTIAVNVASIPQLSGIIGQIPSLYSALLGFDVKPRGIWYEVTETYGPTF